MQFLMLVCTEPEAEPYVAAEDTIDAWVSENDGLGRRLAGDRFEAAEAGRTVRVRSGARLVTEGPYAEALGRIVGFDLLECSDMDEAIAIASAHPMARFGRIDLRGLWQGDD